MMGELSQGLLLPCSLLERELHEGDDVTADLHLKKWVPKAELEAYIDLPDQLPFPSFVPRTNEERVQNLTLQLARLEGVEIIATEKRDGTSVTYIKFQDNFWVAGRSRIHTLLNASNNHYFGIKEEYKLEEKMRSYKKNIAIQGEITGPKIGGNRHGIDKNLFHVFKIYSIDESRYLPWEQVLEVCKDLDLPHVRVVFQGIVPKEKLTVEYFLKLASDQHYENGKLAEGIVVLTNSEPRMSFKAISNLYLLEHKL